MFLSKISGIQITYFFKVNISTFFLFSAMVLKPNKKETMQYEIIVNIKSKVFINIMRLFIY